MHAKESLLGEAQACAAAGRLDEAQGKFESAAALDPANPGIHHAIGVVAYQRGRFEESVAALQRALELHPGFDPAFNACGLALKALGRFEEAGRMFAGALAIRPTYHEAAYNLGVLLQDSEPQLAERYYRMALAANPDGPAILGNLGNLLRRAGRAREADPFLRRAAQLAPGDANALGNLALVRLELGDTAQAHALAERATRLAPGVALWWDTAGSALLGADPDAAVPLLERARSLAPQDAETALKLGKARGESGDHEGALRDLADAKSLEPQNESMRWAVALALPAIVADDASALAAVEHFDRGVEAIDRGLRLDTPGACAAALEAARMDGPFSLHYLPGKHVEHQARFSALVARAARAALPGFTTQLPAIPRRERLRVGFVSSFLRTHVVTRFFGASITGLDPREFERHAWLAGEQPDSASDALARGVDRFESVPADPHVLAQRIRDARLDVLVFPDIGLDPLMTVLASLRLAPVQAAFYGHPVTTGLDSIEAFLSGDALEPADGASDYREQLVRLPGLGCRPAAPPSPGNGGWLAALRLPGRPLLLCAQNPRKLTPAFDATLAETLARTEGRLVIFERGKGLTRRFLERLRPHLVARDIDPTRVVATPVRAYPEYLGGLAAADFILDTPGFSGGATSLDALGLGVPVVAFEGRHARGRQTSAMLHMAGVDELVAGTDAQYVEVAARLAADEALRRSLRERLREGSRAVFEDDRPLLAFADYLRQARR